MTASRTKELVKLWSLSPDGLQLSLSPKEWVRREDGMLVALLGIRYILICQFCSPYRYTDYWYSQHCGSSVLILCLQLEFDLSDILMTSYSTSKSLHFDQIQGGHIFPLTVLTQCWVLELNLENWTSVCLSGFSGLLKRLIP